MSAFKQKTSSYEENRQFLSNLYKSKQKFVYEYKKLYHGKIKAKELYLQILTDLEIAISLNNVDSFKNLSTIIDYINKVENQLTLKTYYDDIDNPLRGSNLVILACKYNKVEILKYIFNNNNFTINIGQDAITPEDKDGTSHNAFYYAIRSNNVELLGILIDKWSDEFYTELERVLSEAYEELKLKNVPLSDEIEIFVENELLNFRFFSNNYGQVQNDGTYLSNIKKRIGLVIEKINFLNLYLKEVNERFIFVAKFIARNIHVLKQQLKSTYDRLPWEEIEFCLVSFISAHLKQQEINLFYHATLSNDKILNHLKNFGRVLEEEKGYLENIDFKKLADLPKLNREKIVVEIIIKYPQFKDLYDDYQQIRDMYSLEKISNYIKLALSANAEEKEGQLVIIRTIQIIGECLKNTLESPKLSKITSELLLLSLPKNTREVIIDLRNSLSHASSLSKRIKIEENENKKFFIGIQKDIKKIDTVISDIFYSNKIKMIRILLNNIINSESFDEIKEISKLFNNVELDSNERSSIFSAMMKRERLKTLIEELRISKIKKTSYEEDLCNKIINIIKLENTKLLENVRNDYAIGIDSLKYLITLLKNHKIDKNFIRVIKYRAKKILQNLNPLIELNSLKEITNLSRTIYQSVISRTQHDSLDEIHKLICELFHFDEFGVANIKWIDEFREKLNENGSFILERKRRKTFNVPTEEYNNLLKIKLSTLESILRENSLTNQLNRNYPTYKKNTKLQVLIEMLILDIMSILGDLKYLKRNLLFLDDNSPTLTGKYLRNHLAHDNILIDILLTDPSKAIILNAKKLIAENLIENINKVDKAVKDSISNLDKKYDRGLFTVSNQERSFVALEEGNFEEFKVCLKKGADVNAISINSWTTLHFAAKGSSVEVIQFILDQNLSVNLKEINGQKPLHIAAANGRKSIVKFFIEEKGLYVGDMDNMKETPLHIAAQNGHIGTVNVLLRNKANTVTKNVYGLSPLHYAIRNGHIDVFKVLLKQNVNVDMNETLGGFTPLHEAAERGCLEMVIYLLQNKANANAKNDKNWTPLHAAALNGHLEVANALILKGADVNSRVLDGCTPLHYAVENGHEKIVTVLLDHGANINVIDKFYNNSALHYAAKDGREIIVNILLKSNANTCITTFEGMTPLHFAAQSGHLGIVSALLEHGANINVENIIKTTPLHYAAEMGHIEIVSLLIKKEAKIDARNNNNITPLYLSALEGHNKIVDLLIKNKSGINFRTNDGLSPLHAAVKSGNTISVDLLIENEAQVNTTAENGFSPLHLAATKSRADIIDLLIKNNAEVNARAISNITPLHEAVMAGDLDIIKLLLKNRAEVNARDLENRTPLDIAVEVGCKKVIEILIENRADINPKNKDSPIPLSTAVKFNNKEIVEYLIASGADVNIKGGEPLLSAVLTGQKDIVNILLKNEAKIDMNFKENATLLHLASAKGYKWIVNALIAKGAEVDATTRNNATPLYFAARKGHEEVVEVLILKGANINAMNTDGTSLHIAASLGHDDIVELLLNNGANINIRDNKNRTPIELAVAHDHLKVVSLLLEYNKVDVVGDGEGNYGLTMLHIAAQEGNLKIIRFLVKKRVDINSKNDFGSKPIHIAAREGYKNIVEFFLLNGLSINDLGVTNQTLLHYSAILGQLEVAEYLIEQGIDVNTKDANGVTPLHIAALHGHKDFIQVLLKNGAIYDTFNNLNMMPIEMTNDRDVFNLLSTTGKLFEAATHNNSSEVLNYIKAGGFVNAKNSRGTPLHFASWKGYDEVVNILLQNQGNPNSIASKGITPLHYAAKFGHLNVVKALLSNGAIYNAISDSGKTPLDFAEDENVISLIKFVSESFEKVTNSDFKIIKDIKRIQDFDTLKVVMNSRNREHKTLVVIAIDNDFPIVEKLKQIILQDDANIEMANQLAAEEQYQKALNIFRLVSKKRISILGPDNPVTLDIQGEIARMLYKLHNYQEALNSLNELNQKQNKVLGINNKDTLNTRGIIALVLFRQGYYQKALDIYKEVYGKQKKILEKSHRDILNTQAHMALVLDRQNKYEEALGINYEVLEIRKHVLGIFHPETLIIQNNIALILSRQDKLDEAYKMYQKVYEARKIILGPYHSDTLRTQSNAITVLRGQKKYDEALKAFKELYENQKSVLGTSHPDTLRTQYDIGTILFDQGKFIGAFKNYNESLDQRKAILGPNHPDILDTVNKINRINLKLNLDGSSKFLQYLQTDINIAAFNGETQTVQNLIQNGADVNDKDVDGRTPLHFAINSGHINIINILLKNGADVTQVTNKGNNPLHTATVTGNNEMVEVLLQNVNRNRLNNFINAQTTNGGASSLHVAAKNGFVEIVTTLMRYGASYNIKNKDRKTPLDISKEENIINLLKLVRRLFFYAKNGKINNISELKGRKQSELVALTCSRNDHGNTAIQVAIANGHKNVAIELLEMLKNPT